MTSSGPNRVLKVGLLYSGSGVTAEAEKTQRSATILAVEELNEAGGIRGGRYGRSSMVPRGSVLDKIYVFLDPTSQNFDKVIACIAEAKPDVVFSTVVGRATAMLYEIFAKAGFDSARMPIANQMTSEAEITAMSHQGERSHITAAPFFEAVSSAVASAFRATRPALANRSRSLRLPKRPTSR